MRRKTSGFTLTEVLVASFVMVLGLGSALIALSSSQRLAQMTNDYSRGMHLARQSMEMLLSESYNSSDLSLGTHSTLPGSSSGFYAVTANGTHANTKDIQLTVYWVNTRTGSTGTYSMVFCMSKALHP